MRRFFINAIVVTAWLDFAQPSWSQGTIVYYQPATPIPLFTTGFAEYYSLDLDADFSGDLTFTYSFQFLGVQPEGTGRILTLLDPPPNVGGSVAPLPPGTVVGADSEAGSLGWYGRALDYNTLVICFDAGCGGAFVGHQAYMGVEFQRAGSTHYGWVLLNIAGNYPSGTIESWAWEARPGVPILAGAVPEPSTPCFLMLGGVFLTWFRSRSGCKFVSIRAMEVD